MKKTVLMLVAVLAMVPAVCQPALTKGMEGKRLTMDDVLSGQYVGTLSNMDAWIFEGKKHLKQLVLTDVNLETVSVVPMPKSGEMEVLTAGVVGNRAGVMLVDRSDNKRTVIYGCSIDGEGQSLVNESYDTLLTLEYGKKDKCIVWGAASPSGNYLALASVLQYGDKQQYSTYVALFDGAMRRVWDREYPLQTMHEMFVTDEGRIVTLGMEPEGEETRFVYNVFDAGRAETYGMSVKCDPISELHLVNVVGPYAVAMGLYHPTGMKKAERYINGVVGISFNVDNAELKGFTMRPFQNEDMNVLLNKKTKKIQKEQYGDHIKMFELTRTPFGAAMALGRVLTVEKTSQNGSVSRQSYAVGLSVSAVDTLGRLRWTRNFRRNDVDKEGLPLERIAMSTSDGKVCLVRSEHRKAPLIYDIANEAKEFSIGDKCNVVLYTIDADGTTEKIILESKVKHNVVRALTRRDDTLLFFSGRSGKTRMAELRFHY